MDRGLFKKRIHIKRSMQLKQVTLRLTLAEKNLKNIEWLLTRSKTLRSNGHKILGQPYGSLAELNTYRRILNAVGEEILHRVAHDYLDLMETASAIYEKNGDYAMDNFTSGWCRFLNQASFNLCGTTDNKKALASGIWHCHESCWTESAKVAIETAKPVDIECRGGIRIYAVPLVAKGEAIGAINFAYGSPPTDHNRLQEIAELYRVPTDKLMQLAVTYLHRPPYIIDIAKQRLHTSAILISTIVERKEMEDEFKRVNQKLVQEIAERKVIEAELRESREIYRSLFNNCPEAILLTDPDDGRIYAANHGACQIFGYTEKELLEINRDSIVDLADPRLPLFRAEKACKGSAKGELDYKRKNGTIFPGEVTAALFIDKNGYPRATMVIRDITQRKQDEQKIWQLNQNLQRRAMELEVINKELASFSYSVSHDLRSPLRSIDGFSQVLLEDYADKLDSQGRDYLRRVRQASQRMGQLIDDLLKLSRVTRQELTLSNVDLTALAWQIITNLHDKQPERSVECVITPGMTVQGDARLIKIALENLLGNAWKFTDKVLNSKIEFGVLEQKGKTVYYISDNGAGFEMEYSSKMFGAFQRLHNMNEFPGNGIGLATVQRIIHRHGGQVWAKGTVNQGAIFYFTLKV